MLKSIPIGAKAFATQIPPISESGEIIRPAVADAARGLEKALGRPVTGADWTVEFWQSILDTLCASDVHYGTRLRYRRGVIEVAEEWRKRGWVATAPTVDELRVSPRHIPPLSVALHRLGDYRFSDYQTFTRHLAGALSGRGEDLVPPGLLEHQDDWLAAILALSGACPPNMASRLAQLQVGDIATEADLPLYWPRTGRRGYVWLPLNRMASLFLLCKLRRDAAQLKRQDAAVAPLFGKAPETLRAGLQQLLRQECAAAHLPPLTLDDLTTLVPLDLSQCLTPYQVAVLMGKVDIIPVARSQMPSLVRTLLDQPKTRVALPATAARRAPAATAIPASAPGTRNNHEDQWLEGLAAIKDEIRLNLSAMSSDCVPGTTMTDFEAWSLAARASADQTRRTVGWLVAWLLDMTSDCEIEPGTRLGYWDAAWRVVRQAPALALTQMDTGVLSEILLEMPAAASTRRLTKSAWRRFHEFLQTAKLPVSDIHWDKVVIQRETESAQVLTGDAVLKVLAELRGTIYYGPTLLAACGGLRVSEPCAMLMGDLILEGRPYMIIHDSKGGKSRLVDLTHLTEFELDELAALKRSRGAAPPTAHLCLDEAGQPLDSKAVSECVGKIMTRLGLRPEGDETGQALSFHDIRHWAADEYLESTGSLPDVAGQNGHALAKTTAGYLHLSDLHTVPLLRDHPSPLNDPNLPIPLCLLEALLGLTDTGVRKAIRTFNAKLGGSEPSISIVTESELTDGPRPRRPGRKPLFVTLADALRLVAVMVASR